MSVLSVIAVTNGDFRIISNSICNSMVHYGANRSQNHLCYISSRFYTIHECDKRTDRHTELS